MIEHIRDLKSQVAEILEKKERARDDDYYLLSYLWYYQIPVEDRDTIKAKDFLINLSKGAFSSPESIRRLRQLLQAERPELRGKRYKERKLKQEQKVRNKIKSI